MGGGSIRSGTLSTRGVRGVLGVDVLGVGVLELIDWPDSENLGGLLDGAGKKTGGADLAVQPMQNMTGSNKSILIMPRVSPRQPGVSIASLDAKGAGLHVGPKIRKIVRKVGLEEGAVMLWFFPEQVASMCTMKLIIAKPPWIIRRPPCLPEILSCVVNFQAMMWVIPPMKELQCL